MGSRKRDKMMLPLAFALVFSCSVLAFDHPRVEFEKFKLMHGKNYASLEEEETRFGHFFDNLVKIEQHNSESPGQHQLHHPEEEGDQAGGPARVRGLEGAGGHHPGQGPGHVRQLLGLRCQLRHGLLRQDQQHGPRPLGALSPAHGQLPPTLCSVEALGAAVALLSPWPTPTPPSSGLSPRRSTPTRATSARTMTSVGLTRPRPMSL